MYYIFGASGFAKEVLWILKENNIQDEAITFVDYKPQSKTINNVVVISEEQFFALPSDTEKNCIVAVGSPVLKQKIVNKLKQYKNILFPNIFHPNVQYRKDCVIFGEGNVVCAGSILTTNIQVMNFVHFNLNTTIGHDSIIGSYCTFSPACNISGNTNIGNRVFFGTNAVILEQLKVVDDAVIGAGAVVVKDINEAGTYVGIPAKKRS